MNNKVKIFKALHVPGDPLILFNIWDAGSARAVANAGAAAIGTGSFGVAEAQGFKDGETFELENALTNLERILRVTDLPVTIDMESGYGSTVEEVKRSVERAFVMGAAGINLEDRMPGVAELTPIAIQAGRVAAAAKTGIFVNARSDVFLGKPVGDYDAGLVEQVLERARAYADAGAGGLFVPFTNNLKCIAEICEGSPIPVNILWTPTSQGGFRNAGELAELGVARISHGHKPWAAAMKWLTDAAAQTFTGNAPPYDAG